MGIKDRSFACAAKPAVEEEKEARGHTTSAKPRSMRRFRHRFYLRGDHRVRLRHPADSGCPTSSAAANARQRARRLPGGLLSHRLDPSTWSCGTGRSRLPPGPFSPVPRCGEYTYETTSAGVPWTEVGIPRRLHGAALGLAAPTVFEAGGRVLPWRYVFRTVRASASRVFVARLAPSHRAHA